MKKMKANYESLPRGGFLIDTKVGYVQFGTPPETIKDTMKYPKGVPQIFVLMDKMFDWKRGISLAEIEFPIYFNFFIKKRKTLIVCSEEQLEKIKKVLQESLFGPAALDISVDYDLMNDDETYPNLKSELDYFRNDLKLSDLVNIGVFQNNKFEFNDIVIEKDKDSNFSVYDNTILLSNIPGIFSYTPKYQIGKRLPEPYSPPLFSITCLGPSHGFDPDQNTSGYIIWLNHHGIMIDPPVNSTEWLESSNVNPKLIDSIILTHCHADHDAGTFQKILEEGKITIYSTETVIMSFLRKYSALSGEPVEFLMKLFKFHPIKINKPLYIHGAKFNTFYTLHSIPTFGFKMSFQDQTFVYSSDHNNDPSIHQKLLDTKVISQERFDELKNFPWDSRVIYHEAGVPPLHTPIAYLNSLDEEIKKKTVVYHIAKKDVPEDTSLTLATFGMENTLTFPTETPYYDNTYLILNILKHLDFFNDLTIEKIQEFITIVKKVTFKKGDHIIEKGTYGDKFYIIYLGNVSVSHEGLEHKKIYSSYEYFGESALLFNKKRMADIHAETDVIAYSISRDEFLYFISGTEFEKTLIRLSKTRNSDTWNLLSSSKFFKYCSSYQKTWLESIFIPLSIEKNTYIISEGDLIENIYIINEGTVIVSQNSADIATLTRGDFIGTLYDVYKNKPLEYSFRNEGSIQLYKMSRKEISQFINSNPGLIMKFTYDF
ncbi:MAG: hypothetical protein A2015_17480 [Spirochaetes bacterium GWF1_31_7]|nr:MAG: hypothetical protein A2Y30_05470 [Spirochaetes bacterium GWE1_32_154]OHD46245.1 MAG: hypothetical protein A2Y29_08475 [Spirochaetes bacterium GWE2_31_10]OHD48615.1 MAG: hypothetical protein A2015_17480 [Spirochaetes bacterium GWF1_31_7]HBD93061.1 cAMP/cGMP-dependent 3',5'-cyclic-AMP/GMP phosphodiesterase [Spirochaetia bacterium]HBI39200.1 cAMP/cGMP-dependent 3',5'-cyclic-AMP/GMP phosphodiesterase [Spirochaetia bacterium]